MMNERKAPGAVGRALRIAGSGMAGTAVLTGLHEIARRTVPHAPRMDVVGQRALVRALAGVGVRPPRGKSLFDATLAGEVVSNGLYYGIVGASRPARMLRHGTMLGLAAGLGAALLPPRLGLGRAPVQRHPVTPLLTVAWYTAGGLAAGAVARLLSAAPAGGD